MRKSKLNKIYMKMILDFTGAMPLARQPKLVSELEKNYNLFKTTQPERCEEAIKIIVNKKIPNSNDNTALIAAKVTEYIEDGIEILESKAIANATMDVVRKIDSMGEEITSVARKEIEKAKKEFYTIKVKSSGKPAKEVKGVVCEEFETLLQLAQERINIMMVGPSGAGKTHIAGQIADALDLDYASQSCTAGMSESQLTGWLLPIGDGSAFEYVPSEFIRIYENGGVFLFDEMDASDSNVLIFINQALANDKFSLPQRFDNPTIKKHKNFVAVAAANTFGGGADAMYHARNALDAATLDRFRMGMIAIDYSGRVEEMLVRNDVLEWGIKVRNIVTKHGMRKVMSTRFMRDASIMIDNQGWNMAKVAKSYFADWSKEEMLVIKRDFWNVECVDEECPLTDELREEPRWMS